MAKYAHWAPGGMYALCRYGGYNRLAATEEEITCKRCLLALAKLREREAGLHLKPDSLYARELGIRTRTVKRLGGSDYLRSLSPDILAVVLNHARRDNRSPKRKPIVEGFLIQPHVPGAAFEMALSDEDLEGGR